MNKGSKRRPPTAAACKGENVKMEKWLRILSVASLVICFLFTGSLAFAKGSGKGKGMPGGFEKGEKKGWGESQVPPGWSHGKKKGWDDKKMPPGLAKDLEESEEG